MRIRFFGLLIFIPLVFTSCQPKNKHFFIPAELSAITKFGDGSYWVYQLKGNSLIDSIWQVSHEDRLDKENRGDFIANKHEFNTSFKYKRLPSFELDFMNSSRINFDPNTDQGNKPSVEIFNMGFLGITETKLVYPFGTKATDGKGTVADSVITELVVAGKKFMHVVRVYQEESMLYGPHIHFYYAPNVGLIRVDEMDYNNTWELVRYNIAR